MFDVEHIVRHRLFHRFAEILTWMGFAALVFGILYFFYWLCDHNYIKVATTYSQSDTEKLVEQNRELSRDLQQVYTPPPVTKKNAIVNLEGLRYVVIEYTSSCEVQFSGVKIVMPESRE